MLTRLILINFVLVCGFTVHAQFGQQWLQSYNDEFNQDNWANQIVLTNSGCVIVGGTSMTSLQTQDINFIKYDASGNELWQASYSLNSFCIGLVLTTDETGNIYAAASILAPDATQEIIVLKFSCNGEFNWNGIYPFAHDTNFVHSITRDLSGNIYIGASSSCPPFSCYVPYVALAESNMLKFDSEGNFLFERRAGYIQIFSDLPSVLPYSNLLTEMNLVNDIHLYAAISLVQDSMPSIPQDDTWDDFALAKYHTDGTRIFMNRLTRRDKNDIPVDLFMDADENSYITGVTTDTISGSFKRSYLTTKFNSEGEVLYVTERGNPAWNSEGMAIVADELGNAFVAGITLENGATTDIELIKYDPNGNELWVSTYNSDYDNFDNPNGGQIYLDDQSNIYVAGSSWNNDNIDFIVLKFGPEGNLLEEFRFNGESNEHDMLSSIVFNSSQEFFLTGSSSSNTLSDIVTIKYGFETTETGDALCPPINIREQDFATSTLFIFPNPAHSEVTLSTAAFIHEVKITDALGTEVKHPNLFSPTKELRISIADLSYGVYFVTAITRDGERRARLVKD